MVKLLAEHAFAKINLFLRVIGRRADGYHELDSIFVPVSISDRVAIELRPGAEPAIKLRCNLPALANAQLNLAARAARAFVEEFAIAAQLTIDLEKTIPAGAGLGGGSSDAGAVLRMLTAMTATMRPYADDFTVHLQKIAVALGADVPFFLDPRPSRVTGIGEHIAPLAHFPKLNLVLAVPPLEASTAAVFKALRRDNFSGTAPQRDIEEIVRGAITARHLVNDLAVPAMELYPQIAHLKALLQDCGAEASSMSGSGSAVFGIFRDREDADRAAASLRVKAPEARVFVAQSL